jgi:hypothetical protein
MGIAFPILRADTTHRGFNPSGIHYRKIVGYDVHITRRPSWSDPAGPEILLSEWIAVVESDPEMRLDGYAEARGDNGEMLRLERAGLSVWIAYSGHERAGNMAWFDFHRGGVVVKNPDSEMLMKMWSLAQRLSATVQGDEGELYDASGDAIRSTIAGPPARKSWWKFW